MSCRVVQCGVVWCICSVVERIIRHRVVQCSLARCGVALRIVALFGLEACEVLLYSEGDQKTVKYFLCLLVVVFLSSAPF